MHDLAARLRGFVAARFNVNHNIIESGSQGGLGFQASRKLENILTKPNQTNDAGMHLAIVYNS